MVVYWQQWELEIFHVSHVSSENVDFYHFIQVTHLDDKVKLQEGSIVRYLLVKRVS